MAHRLRRVAVEPHAPLAATPSDLGDRLKGADFIVGRHDADESGRFSDRSGDIGRIDKTIRVDTEYVAIASYIEDGPMFRRHRDDGTARSLDREVVGLGGAAGENDFVGVRADERSDLGPRLFHGIAGLAPVAMG